LTVSRRRRAGRRLLGAALAVLTGLAGGVVLYQTSVQPGAAIVKAVFERRPEVTPPAGFSAIARTVAEQRVPIPTPDAPVAHLDIFTPNAPPSRPLPVIVWIHGGGFISSSAATVADYAIMLAHAGYVVASLDYTLAPGAHYPVPVR
jgi:acetyl esterase/lipase